MQYSLFYHLICCILIQSFYFPSEVSGFSYIGCYWNDDNNTLNGYYPPEQTTIQCFLKCITADKGYTYAGTQTNPIGCYCGTSINDQGYYSKKECNLPCPVANSDLCGGKNRLAVFNITGETIPIKIAQAETTTLVKSDETSEPMSCLCPCAFSESKWNFLENMNITKQEIVEILKDEIEELQKNLTVDAKTTSIYKNSKRSAPDDRTSSVLMGVVGGFVICIPVLMVILFDVMRYLNNQHNVVHCIIL